MQLILTKRNFKIFYSKENDNYVVYNLRKEWKDGHTHVNKYEQALYLIDCVTKRKIPKRVNKYFLISLIRLSKDDKYINKIQRIVDGEEPKQNYRNVPKNMNGRKI